MVKCKPHFRCDDIARFNVSQETSLSAARRVEGVQIASRNAGASAMR